MCPYFRLLFLFTEMNTLNNKHNDYSNLLLWTVDPLSCDYCIMLIEIDLRIGPYGWSFTE